MMTEEVARMKAAWLCETLGEGWEPSFSCRTYKDVRGDRQTEPHSWSYGAEKDGVRVHTAASHYPAGDLGQLAAVHNGYFFAVLTHPSGKRWPLRGTSSRAVALTESVDPREAVRTAIGAEREAHQHFQECIENAERVVEEFGGEGG